jgi:ribosomal protein L11 methyltransferase
MRELALRVPAAAVEEALDALLPIAPHGVLEVGLGDEVELRVRGAADRAAVMAAARPWTTSLHERDVPDDAQERRRADHEPIVVADRLVVRPSWAPPPATGLLDVVLADDSAFGAGTHPTTRMCLEALCSLEPAGAALDLGCGSGVLGIAAALLGWHPVVAVDRSPEAVAAACTNARRSGALIDVRAGDVAALADTPASLVLANVPLPAHHAVAQALGAPPPVLIVSGIQAIDGDACAQAYAAAGARESDRAVASGWAALTLRPRRAPAPS